ncbi:MAG: cell division protein FtsQ/DivIB [Verrucomicrobiia bacterium]
MRFWFRRKDDKRYRRELLTLEMRSESTQTRNARLVAFAIGGCFGLLMLFVVIWQIANFVKVQFILKNPAYAIRVIDIQTDGIINREQIRRWAGVQPGDNLIALDIGQVRRNLELIPMIKTVSVEKVFPATLRIRVSEREPVARVMITDAPGVESIYTLDEMGYVMIPLHFSQLSATEPTNKFLPVIIGVGRTDLKIGTRVSSPQLLSALRLLSTFERSPMAGLVNIKTIDISYPGILQAVTDQGSTIIFGIGQFDIQLRRWRMVYDYGRQRGKLVATLDLSVANNVPATWMDISNFPGGAIQNKQPKTVAKKKNV